MRVDPGRQRQDVVRDRPALLLAHRVREGGHRRPIQPERHRAEDIAHIRAALELAAREIGRPDGKAEVVLQLGRRHAVALAALPVALEALGLPVELPAAGDELRRGLRRLADHERRLGLFVLPSLRERLDEGHHRQALLVGQLMPGGHRRPPHAARDGAEQITVGGQGPGRGRAELEDADGEIARARKEEGGGRAIAIAYAQAGAAVCCAARTGEEITTTVCDIATSGGRALAVPADVTQLASVQQMLQTTAETFGGLDILVINAGAITTGGTWQRAIPKTGVPRSK